METGATRMPCSARRDSLGNRAPMKSTLAGTTNIGARRKLQLQDTNTPSPVNAQPSATRQPHHRPRRRPAPLRARLAAQRTAAP